MLEKLGGKRGGQTLAGMLQDFDQVEFAMKQMQGAAGSADAEMGVIEDSLDYKLNKLKQTWVGFLQELIDRGDIGDLFDSLTDGSESLTSFLKTLTPVLKGFIQQLDGLLSTLSKIMNSPVGTFLPYLIGGGILGNKIRGNAKLDANDALINVFKKNQETSAVTPVITSPIVTSTPETSGLGLSDEEMEELSNDFARIDQMEQTLSNHERQTSENIIQSNNQRANAEEETDQRIILSRKEMIQQLKALDKTSISYTTDATRILFNNGDVNSRQIAQTILNSKMFANNDEARQGINSQLASLYTLQDSEHEYAIRRAAEEQMAADIEASNLRKQQLQEELTLKENAIQEAKIREEESIEELTAMMSGSNIVSVSPVLNLDDMTEMYSAQETADWSYNPEQDLSMLDNENAQIQRNIELQQERAEAERQAIIFAEEEEAAYQDIYDIATSGLEEIDAAEQTRVISGEELKASLLAEAEAENERKAALQGTIEEEIAGTDAIKDTTSSLTAEEEAIIRAIAALENWSGAASAAVNMQNLLAIGSVDLIAKYIQMSDAELQEALESENLAAADRQVIEAILELDAVKKGEIVTSLKHIGVIQQETQAQKENAQSSVGLMKGLSSISGAAMGVGMLCSTLASNIKDEDSAMKQNLTTIGQMSMQLGMLGMAIPQVVNGLAALSGGTGLAGAAATLTNPYVLAAAAAVAAGVIFYEAITYQEKYRASLEKTVETSQNARNELNKQIKEYKEQAQTAKTLAEEYDELSQGVDIKTNENKSLSSEDYEKYLSVVNDLSEMYPELNAGVDDNYNAIINLGDGYETATERVKEFIEQQEIANNTEIKNGLSGQKEGLDAQKALMDSYKKDYDDANRYMNQIEQLQTSLKEDTLDLSNGSSFKASVNDAVDLYQKLEALQNQFEKVYITTDEYAKTGYIPDLNIQYAEAYDQATKSWGWDVTWDQAVWDKYFQNDSQKYLNTLSTDVAETQASAESIYNKSKQDYETMVNDYVGDVAKAMTTSATYTQFTDTQRQIADSLIGNLPEAMKEDLLNAEDPVKWYQENILSELQSMPLNGVIRIEMASIFENGGDAADWEELAKQIFEAYGLDWNDPNIDLTNYPIAAFFKAKVGEVKTEENSLFDKYRGQATYRYNDNGAEVRSNGIDRWYRNATPDDQAMAKTDKFWDLVQEGAKDGVVDLDEVRKKYLQIAEVQESLNPRGAIIDSINGLSDGMSVLDKIYADVKDGDTFDFTNLASDNFTETFAGVEDEYEDFIETVSENPADLSATQEAFNDLVDALIDYKGVFKNLNTENANVAESMLENMGVSNAHVVVLQELSKKYQETGDAAYQLSEAEQKELLAAQQVTDSKEQEAIIEGQSIAAKHDLANATVEDITAMFKEAGTSMVVKSALAEAAAAEVLFGDNDLNASQKIADLSAIAQAAWGAAAALEFQNGMAEGKSWASDTDSAWAYIQSKYSSIDVQNIVPDYTGAMNANADATNGAGDAADDANDKLKEMMETYSSLLEIVEDYNNEGAITFDQAESLANMDFKYIAMLKMEGDAVGLNGEAYKDLTQTKRIFLAMQAVQKAIDTVDALKSEADAAELLSMAYDDVSASALDALKAQLQLSLAKKEQAGILTPEQSDQLYNSVEAELKLIMSAKEEDKDTDKDKDDDDDKDKEEDNSQDYDWIETKLSKLEKYTKLISDTVDNMYSADMKNKYINQEISSIQTEISANKKAYAAYMKQANKTGLSSYYKKMVQNGSYKIATIGDEDLNTKIEDYKTWYDKAQECLDTITELYNTERDLIREKLQNLIDSFDSLDERLSSITSSFKSILDLNDAMGKRSSLEDLVNEFAALSDQIEAINNVNQAIQEESSQVITHGESPETAEEIVNDAFEESGNTVEDKTYAEQLEDLNNDIYGSYTYQKNEANLKKYGDSIAAFADKYGKELGEDGLLTEESYNSLSKSQKKKYDKLLANYNKYLSEKAALENNATSDTATAYSKTYEAWYKLDQKIQNGGKLSKSQWTKYNDLTEQLKAYEDQLNSTKETLEAESKIEEATTAQEKIDATYDEAVQQMNESYESQLADANNVRESKVYKNIQAQIDVLNAKKAKKGSLSTKESSKLSTLEGQLAALEAGGTADNASALLKTYNKLAKLQAKMNKKGINKMSASDIKKMEQYQNELDAYNETKQTELARISDEWKEALENLYETYTEESADATEKLNEYYEELYSIVKEIAEYGIEASESRITLIEAEISMLEKEIEIYKKLDASRLEALGYYDSADGTLDEQLYADYEKELQLLTNKYNEQIKQKQLYESLLQAETDKSFDEYIEAINKMLNDEGVSDELKAKLQSAVDLLNQRATDSDTWEEDSDEWEAEWEEALDSVKESAMDTLLTFDELKDTFRDEVVFKAFNDAITKLDHLKSQFSSLASIINDDWLYDDGGITEYGQAKVQLLASELKEAQNLVAEYAAHVSEIANATVGSDVDDLYNTEEDKLEAYTEAMENYSSAVNDVAEIQNSIYEIAQQAAQEEIDGISEMVDKYKEALSAKKELADYKENLDDSQKTVESLEAQIAALEGINNAEANAKRAQLDAQLQEAQDALDDTKEEHQYEVITNALDDLVSKLNDLLEESTESIDKTMEKYAETIKEAIAGSSTVDLNSAVNKVMAVRMDDYSDELANVTISTDTIDSSDTAEYVSITSDNVSTMSESVQKIYNVQATMSSSIQSGITSGLEKMDKMIESMSAIKINTDVIRDATVENNFYNNYDRLVNIESVNMDDISAVLDKASKNTMEILAAQLKRLGYK